MNDLFGNAERLDHESVVRVVGQEALDRMAGECGLGGEWRAACARFRACRSDANLKARCRVGQRVFAAKIARDGVPDHPSAYKAFVRFG